MAEGRSLTISETDYETIEAAVMETERGRWFLKEFARRNRTADTEVLLNAIGRLEQAVAGERVARDVDRLRTNLREMATTITRTKSEIASIHAVEQEHSRLFAASEALDSITRTTEQATSDILAAAEHIQESAWTLREEGANPDLCDDLDRRATEIYTSCSFQDLTAQRIAKVIQTLRYLESRINAMIAAWDGSELPLDGDGSEADLGSFPDLSQSDVDSVIVDDDPFGLSAPAPRLVEAEVLSSEEPDAEAMLVEPTPLRASAMEVLPETGAAPAPAAGPGAFAEIDRMTTREKLRLFT